MADSPEASEHTSIRQRITAAAQGNLPSNLMPFQGNLHQHNLKGIPFALEDYIQLVEWTGRVVCKGKRGAIDIALPPILNRLEMDEGTWFTAVTEFERAFGQWVGSETAIKTAAQNLGKTRSRSPPMRV